MHRYLLLVTGALLMVIGLAYCLDPNLLLGRYELAVVGASEDSMYRGAYGGLFLTLGAAVAFGFSTTHRRNATLLAMLFMGGFALGRLVSIVAAGMPHPQIVGLLLFEVVSVVVFAGLLMADGGWPLSTRPPQLAQPRPESSQAPVRY